MNMYKQLSMLSPSSACACVCLLVTTGLERLENSSSQGCTLWSFSEKQHKGYSKKNDFMLNHTTWL